MVSSRSAPSIRVCVSRFSALGTGRSVSSYQTIHEKTDRASADPAGSGPWIIRLAYDLLQCHGGPRLLRVAISSDLLCAGEHRYFVYVFVYRHAIFFLSA